MHMIAIIRNMVAFMRITMHASGTTSYRPTCAAPRQVRYVSHEQAPGAKHIVYAFEMRIDAGTPAAAAG